jgi:hypothetical protein
MCGWRNSISQFAWLRLTHVPFVINNITDVKIDLTEIPLQEVVPRNFIRSGVNNALVTKVVEEHLKKGIIEMYTNQGRVHF